MKYGILFSLLAILIFIYSVTNGGWFLLLLWPALSFGLVGAAYACLGHRIFGKRIDGSMSRISRVALLPYLLYLWFLWRVLRAISREPAVNAVTDDITIGRRLLSHELPPGIDVVVDLTCEFAEPEGIRSVVQYISFPMLDAAALPAHSLAEFARRLSEIDGKIFIHCAQGHGRTGLITALLLIARGIASDPSDALAQIQSSRQLVGLNRTQMTALRDAAEAMRASNPAEA